MGYVALLVWALICTLLTFFILSLIVNADAYDMFANSIKQGGFKETPVICIDVNNSSQKFLSLKGVKSWEKELRKYTETTNYDYRIRIIDINPTGCDTLITYENPKDVFGKATNTNLGATLCYLKSNERFCRVVINWDLSTKEITHTTIIHEMGHVLGIGHRMPIDIQNFPGVAQIVLEDDVMYPQASPFDKITKQDLDALLFFYNYTGWNKGITDQDYIVPH